MVFLTQPYPFYHRGSSLIRIALLLLVVGFLFEYLIIPFQRNPDEHLYSYAIISLFHVGVAVITYALYFSVLSTFVHDDDWKVYKELIAVGLLLILIGMGEWAIRPVIYDQGGNMSMHTFIEEVWHALLSGGLIYLLATLLNFRWLQHRHNQSAGSIPIHTPSSGSGSIPISTQNASDDFSLNPVSLICVRAEGNYLEFYLKSETGILKSIKRLTLTSLSEQLKTEGQIIKTHRSFMVNPGYITHIKGNAQGYQLTLEGIDFKIPVSRKHLEAFNARVK